MCNQKGVIVGAIVHGDWQLDKLLPKVELVGHADEALEVTYGASRVLLSQEDIILHQLLSLSVLIEGHDCDARVLREGHLDIDPLVQRKEYRVGVRFIEIVLCVDVDAERGLAIVPKRKGLVKTKQMVLVATFGGVRLERMLAKVLHPETRRVADVALLEFEARDALVGKFITASPVKLGHLNLLRGNRVTEWRGYVLLNKVRQH